MMLGCCPSVFAQSDRNQDEPKQEASGVVSQSATDESSALVGIGYHSFDNLDNWSLEIQSINPNKVGVDVKIRMCYETHGNYNIDLGPNYSFLLHSANDTRLFFIAGAGPSIGMRDVLQGVKVTEHEHIFTGGTYTTTTEEWKEKWFLDGFVNLRLTLKYKNVFLSAGYFLWAPKFKFGKNYKIDGFACSIGFGV